MAQKLTKIRFTAEEDAYLREHYPDGDTLEIAETLHRSVRSIWNRVIRLGLRKSDDFRISVGHHVAASEKSQACQFKPGTVPPNKGKQWWQYISPEKQERCKATLFKKGRIPCNARPVGYERVNELGYVLIKVAEHRRMVFKHRWVWEQHHGNILKDMVISFIDGNRLNCDISNLRLIKRAQYLREAYEALSPEERQQLTEKRTKARNELIRKDKMRIRWGLEPKSKIVKHYYEPERR